MPVTKPKPRVSMTFSERYMDYLRQLAEKEDQAPTTYAYELVCSRIQRALDTGEIVPHDQDGHINNNEVLLEFLGSLIDGKPISDSDIEKIAHLTGRSVNQIRETLFWEPENEQTL